MLWTPQTQNSAMGTLVGHVVPGLVFVLLGMWHMVNTINDYYLKGSAKFVFGFWYPFKSTLFALKHFELLSILSFSIFAIFMQVMDYPLFQFSFKLNNFEHATIFLHLAIFSGFSLSAELTHSSATTSAVSGLLASSVFGQELFLLHYHSADHVGLEGHYHWLLQLIVFVSLIASLSSTSFPSSFLAALCLGISVVFQGCWFLNMGLMLWVPKFVPQGCFADLSDHDNMHGAVTCLTHEARSRAMALANMQFSWILAGIMIVASCICLKHATHFRPRGDSPVYEKLHSTGANVSPVYEKLHSTGANVSVAITRFNELNL